jgi:hypothetical protein
MRQRSRILAVIALGVSAAALSGCGDLLLQPDRVPTALGFEEQVVTVTEGDPVGLRPYVVDQDGHRFDRLPLWTGFEWSSSNQRVFDARGFVAGEPGQATARVSFAGLQGEATVRVNPTQINAEIRHAYLVQSIQRRDGGVPLVANRSAILRVFAVGHGINFFQPEAEVVFRVGGEEVGRRTFSLVDGAGIPGSVFEGEFRNSWAVEVPAAWVRPGLSFVLTLDPEGKVPVTDRSNFRFPREGAQAVEVHTVPDLDIRFVPIHQTQFGSTGSINSSTAISWTEFLEDVFPVAGIRRDVRATFHTDAVADGQTDWYRIIAEVAAIRLLDDDDRYYYGVLRRHGGFAGLGYIGWPVSIGWDELGTTAGDPIPLAYTTFAHEMGHNFGRWHAPACGAGNPDINFPHPGGRAGAYGYQGATGSITPPTIPDLMGYCWPHWVSDYTFEGVLRFRLQHEEWRRQPGNWPGARSADGGPGLLVWGTVRDGQVRIEPAIAVDQVRPTPGDPTGPTVEGVDAAGRVLFRAPTSAMAFGHGAEGFTFTAMVPLDAGTLERVVEIRVSGAGVPMTTQRSRRAADADEARALAGGRAGAFAARRTARGAEEVVWDADRFPLLVIRHRDTRDVVAFARTGRFVLPNASGRLQFHLSDGVRSIPARPVTP